MEQLHNYNTIMVIKYIFIYIMKFLYWFNIKGSIYINIQYFNITMHNAVDRTCFYYYTAVILYNIMVDIGKMYSHTNKW